MPLFTSYFASPIGMLQIVATETVITRVSFEETIIETGTPNNLTTTCLQQLTEYFLGERKEFELQVAQTGTNFQQQVWTQLQTIAYGKTISYLQLAKQLGNEKVIRAAGTSNGKNCIAIIVPCHRVIGSNGSLVGYAGGLWRKQWLLEHEAKFAHGAQTLF